MPLNCMINGGDWYHLYLLLAVYAFRKLIKVVQSDPMLSRQAYVIFPGDDSYQANSFMCNSFIGFNDNL